MSSSVHCFKAGDGTVTLSIAGIWSASVKSRQLFWCLALGAFIAVTLSAFGASLLLDPTNFLKELGKAVLNLGVFTIFGAVLGGVIKIAFDRWAKEQDHRRQTSERRRKLIYDFMARVGRAYRDAKACRRQLRSAGLSPRTLGAEDVLSLKQLEVYGDEIKKLSRSQLELEELKIEADEHPDFLAIDQSCGESLERDLRAMERYLRKIAGEAEDVLGALQAETKTRDHESNKIAFKRLRYLAEFTDSHDSRAYDAELRFEKHLKGAHKRIVVALRELLTMSEGE
jgi:hypothetical protein